MKKSIIGLCAMALSYGANASEPADTSQNNLQIRNLDELVVTGSNNAVGRNLIPYTLSVVSADRLEASGNTQLLSALSGMVPSLFVTERNIFGFGVSGGGSGHIKMRGVGGDRASAVLMMVDGQPQFAGIYSHHVADFYGMESVDRVEILRGPASVLYGSNAMAGVINVITKQHNQPGVKTTLTSQYGSYNTWLSSLTNTTRFGKFSSLVSAGYNRTDGVRKNFDFDQTNVYAKTGYDVSSHWNAYADYSFMTFHGNDPVYPSIKGDNGIYRQRIIRGEASLMAVNRYQSSNGVARIYYSYGNHFIHDPNYFHSLDDRFGILVYQNFDLWRGAAATAGFDFDRYSGRIPVSGGKDHSQAPLATMTRRAIIEYSPYVTLQQTLWNEHILLNAGLRMANSDMFGSHWIPQGGIVFSPGREWSLKTSVAKGCRNPSFRELYLYKFANPDLKPETMTNWEVSVGKSFSHRFSLDLTGYYARGRNLIEQTATLNENTGSFVNKGIELSVRSHPLDCLSLWASYSYLHTSLSNLTGAPTQQYYFSAAWDAFKGLRVDAALKGVAGLFVADDVKKQNYATLNLRLSYRLIRQLQLFVDCDNLTDTRYTINKGYPMPGATVMAGFKLTL